YINGHLEEIADGKRYAEIDDRGAQAAVEEAIEAGAPADEGAELQARADELKRQRDTLFRGETLRGLLLSSFAWSTVGRIAGSAAWGAFAGAALVAVLAVLGVIHRQRTKHAGPAHRSRVSDLHGKPPRENRSPGPPGPGDHRVS